MITQLRAALIATCATGATLAVTAFSAGAAPLVLEPAAILAEHNELRAEIGVPPLRWSDKLAQGATQWARTIAALKRIQYSGAPGVGENVGVSWADNASLGQLIGIWTKEKALFQPGLFPQVSRNGDAYAMLHYTQMIWRDTTEVGCGVATSGKSNYLVCRYTPQGNFIGQSPY
jgi:Cysteine-rich secretory protein family